MWDCKGELIYYNSTKAQNLVLTTKFTINLAKFRKTE